MPTVVNSVITDCLILTDKSLNGESISHARAARSVKRKRSFEETLPSEPDELCDVTTSVVKRGRFKPGITRSPASGWKKQKESDETAGSVTGSSPHP